MLNACYMKCKEEVAKQCILADGGGIIYNDEKLLRVNQYRSKSSRS